MDADPEVVLAGLDPAERRRVLVGAIADLDQQIVLLELRQRDIRRQLTELAEQYPELLRE